MNISGRGKIPAGEYNERISVSGSAELEGPLLCRELRVSGSTRCSGRLVCKEAIGVSGSLHVEDTVKAQSISVSGSAKFGSDCIVEGEIRIAGVMHCGSVKCTDLITSGKVAAEHGVEAERIQIDGALQCGGLVNAEELEIKLNGFNASRIGSIGAGTVKIYSVQDTIPLTRLPFLSRLIGPFSHASITVEEVIEGDTIALEYVCAPKVAGKSVAIGRGCRIDLVQYSETIEIHPEAEVGTCEKI